MDPTIPKPKLFYHGSPHRGIGTLEPRSHKVRDPAEGPVVFASPELAFAIMFMAPHSVGSGAFDGAPYLAILADRDEFIKNDRGGHVYVVPGKTFENDPHKGMGEKEWTSKVPVKPLHIIEYPSTLDAAIENGIQVYFIDEPTYDAIKHSDDEGLSIYRKLRSENQRRGKNIRKLE
jgi:hypothetical protein